MCVRERERERRRRSARRPYTDHYTRQHRFESMVATESEWDRKGREREREKERERGRAGERESTVFEIANH